MPCAPDQNQTRPDPNPSPKARICSSTGFIGSFAKIIHYYCRKV